MNSAFTRKEILILCGILLTAVFVRLWFGYLIRDDAFITFRYAQRIADGYGFTFNDGERVLGTSTPLWTLILAAGSYVGGHLTTQALVLGIVGDLATIVLLVTLVRMIWGSYVGLLAGTIYSLLPPAIEHAVSGMETSLYLAFILAAFIFFYKQRLVVTAIFCALTTLIRPEGILVPITLTIVTLWGTSDYRIKIRQLGAPIIVFTLITLPWIFFAWFYFGSVVPQPLVAKSDLGVSGVQSLKYFLAYFANLDGSWSFAIPAFSLVGLIFGFRPFPRALPFLLWSALYIGVFLATSKFVYPLWPFEWYYMPPLLFYSMSAALGFLFVSDRLFRFLRKSAHAASTILFCLISLFVVDSGIHVNHQKSKIRMFVQGRESLYEKMAQMLKDRYGTKESVAAWEIGVLGFRYPGPILDLHGLVTPDSVGLCLAEILSKHKPKWLLSWNTSIAEDVRNSRWFTDHYRLEAEEVNWETRRLQLYRKIAE